MVACTPATPRPSLVSSGMLSFPMTEPQVDQVQDRTLAFELRRPREAFGDATLRARGRRVWSEALTPRCSAEPCPAAPARAAAAGALGQRAREEERRSARTGANNMPSARTSDTRGVAEWVVAWQPSTAGDEVLAANLQIADWLEGDLNSLTLAGLDSRGERVNGGAGVPAHSLFAREEERRESFPPPPLSPPFEEPAVSLASGDRSSEEASRRASSTHVPVPSPRPAGVSTGATRGAAHVGRRQAGGGAQGQTGTAVSYTHLTLPTKA